MHSQITEIDNRIRQYDQILLVKAFEIKNMLKIVTNFNQYKISPQFFSPLPQSKRCIILLAMNYYIGFRVLTQPKSKTTCSNLIKTTFSPIEKWLFIIQVLLVSNINKKHNIRLKSNFRDHICSIFTNRYDKMFCLSIN